MAVIAPCIDLVLSKKQAIDEIRDEHGIRPCDLTASFEDVKNYAVRCRSFLHFLDIHIEDMTSMIANPDCCDESKKVYSDSKIRSLETRASALKDANHSKAVLMIMILQKEINDLVRDKNAFHRT